MTICDQHHANKSKQTMSLACYDVAPPIAVASRSCDLMVFIWKRRTSRKILSSRAKVTWVPHSVNLTGKRDKGGHGVATINYARIISH